ncbi:hypothetical protein EV702DRAFT_920286, partial [Suillus placidus]
MLDKDGVTYTTSQSASLRMCTECYRSLGNTKIPRCAIANKLYRGRLPSQFHDLTWVEEMVCAVYRNTAHVTRLYQSSDPAQPMVFHGNTCAHKSDVVSTVRVLPRTPADINGMISVVFLGPNKLDPHSLRTIFCVRKWVVWNFLLWLCTHNRLYQNITLDGDVMDLYPEDGTVPGLAERMVYD